MTAIKIDDPVIEKIIQQEGIETITDEILAFIKVRFLAQKNSLIDNNKAENKALAKSFLLMTKQVKEDLSRNYTAKEAKELYGDRQL